MQRTVQLEAAYAECCAIAKREAKNFYYGFLALPKHKREAMCAVYAFMRRADDISDDESFSLETRRIQMAAWLASWNGFRSASFHDEAPVLPEDKRDHAVFLAVADVQQRFGVSDRLLEQLIAGTTMDLKAEAPEGVVRLQLDGRTVDVYETMQALEGYCYLVASVVGLTTIRIFGYRDHVAEDHAEKIGLAFQLTNILRDVKEDAERGRVYLPEDLLAKHKLTPQDVLTASASGEMGPALRALLAEVGTRAEQYYAATENLIPLLDRDSRPAMRVLTSIYHLLLKEIVAHNYDVLRQRVSVSSGRKMRVLAGGMVRALLARGGAA
ncbi:phytoene/squalene synthase family protein [Terriglobus sp. TAA 43]|uniref:phytoene/squalene synthase family protein n=1 Tax=Terriglobus sp. TAA 43 TaxID=278961 RepID=UPI000645A8FA|nr:phytoene/squalene synthase family protein [Terriglobus sp. TAA 43]